MTQYAIIIELLEWDCESPRLEIDSIVTFINIENHFAGILQNKLFEPNSFADDKFFSTAILITDDAGYSKETFPSDETYSYSTELLTILTLIFKGSLGQCRVIISMDEFKTAYSSFTLYETSAWNYECLTSIDSKLNQKTFDLVNIVWQNLRQMPNYPKFHPRVINAFDFFYFSWNSIHLYQTALSISVVLETLFSPHSANELSHQIAFNVAKFYHKEKKDRIEAYSYVKKYYSVRSKLIHGDDVSTSDLNLIHDFFKFICELFLKIISSPKLIEIFNDNNCRKKYFEELLFE